MRGNLERLRDEIRRFDKEMRRLSDLGIDLSLPDPALRGSLQARGEEIRRQYEELEATRHQADRQLLAALLRAYLNGSDTDRRNLRDLLAEYDSFRWGFGCGLAACIASEDDARQALAVLSLKDGDKDYRDQIVALDRLCAAIRKVGLPVAALLREAAVWSSDIERFAPAQSTRALLLDYAERFAR